MKKTLAVSLVLLLVGLVSLSAICPTQADINNIQWVKPIWKNKTDTFLGFVAVAYVEGSTWTLNVEVDNYETNGTDTMRAHIYRIAVWFDWDEFYNSSQDFTLGYGETHLFTISNTMEDTSVASNLFTHSYKIYVEFKISYKKGGASVTEERTWEYPTFGMFSGFAVLSQDQYDAWLAQGNFNDYYNRVNSYIDDYTESLGLEIQALREKDAAELLYDQGEFSGALQHYNTGSGLLNQSFAVYLSKQTEYDAISLNDTKADLDKKLAETEAIRANATATRTLAEATASAMFINSFAFVFFGLGFMFFGVAAIVYAWKKSA